MDEVNLEGAVCPVPLSHHDTIVLGHGSGGKMSSDLISKVFLPIFDNPALRAGNDGALLSFPDGNIAISTDSHVVDPLFFPGGDIGHLAICGTVNDVSMMGADPLYLTAGFILEEGLPMETLRRVVQSMKAAADEAGIAIVSGDTKVVQRGKADGLYINTTGIGHIRPGTKVGGANAQPGDVVILSGPIGDHGIAVLAARGDLGLETDIRSDTAPLNKLVSAMLDACPDIHVLRDPTRGGVATTLNEIAVQSNVGIMLDEAKIPVRQAVASVCEMLGFDPLYIANEGKLLAIVPQNKADKILEAMHRTKYGEGAVIIGEIVKQPEKRVLLRTAFGTTRIVDVLLGELLPRIC
jgi:hydrogenase expression/formation protein HypE